MSWDFDAITRTAKEEISGAADARELEAHRVKYLGRKGLLTEIYAALGQLSPEEKPLAGKKANELRVAVNGWLDERKKDIESQGSSRKADGADVTLPGALPAAGRRHILSQTIEEICEIFQSMGFSVQESPEIESEFNNFTALNIPVDHPSRDAFDTFYVDRPDPQKDGRNLLLRSQTSPGQIRIMQEHKPPFAVVIPGRVYRPDALDATHSFMFHQIEGLLVGEDINFAHLKGLLTVFCKRFFGENIKMRFRPHFFPFTEPSAEVDISVDFILGRGGASRKPWLEIMGCGLVHPKVFDAVKYPKGKYTGLAFGMGVERIAMLKYGINDIRLFSENDVRFLKQF